METNNLNPKEVMPRGNTLRDIEVVPAAVLDEPVDGPSIPAQTLVSDLEPPQSVRASGSGVVDLGQVGHDGALVRRGDWMVRVRVVLWPSDNVTPPRADTSTSGDGVDGIIFVDLLVAGEVAIVDIQDGLQCLLVVCFKQWSAEWYERSSTRVLECPRADPYLDH